MAIEVNNLTKAYGTQKVVHHISFSLAKGEIVGFLGPNGAGKSTTMKMLTTFVRPTEGTARINGYDLRSQQRKVRQSIGYLPEHNPQYLDMYVKEFLQFTAEMYAVHKKAVEDVIVRTGLSLEAHKKIGQLSKGYQQRVGLAAALVHDPEVLILDEPTTGLDPNQLTTIRHLIRSMGEKKTIILSTHILQEVEAMCSRVLIMNKGKIVADKSLKDLRNTDTQIIEVEFDYRVEEAFLEKLPHIETVKNRIGFVYELCFATEKDMRPTVFDFAHDNDLKILQLTLRHKSLEHLFTTLTASSS